VVLAEWDEEKKKNQNKQNKILDKPTKNCAQNKIFSNKSGKLNQKTKKNKTQN